MAGARLESKTILLHSEVWKGRSAPIEMQQRVQNIHAWILRRFCADWFSMSRVRRGDLLRRWLPKPIPAIKYAFFAWTKPWIVMLNSQSLCQIIVWSFLATCCRANGFFNQQLISGLVAVFFIGKVWQSDNPVYHQGEKNRRASTLMIFFSKGHMFSFVVIILFWAPVIRFFFPTISHSDGSLILVQSSSFKNKCTHLSWYLKQTVGIQCSATASGTRVAPFISSQDILVFCRVEIKIALILNTSFSFI